MPDYLTAKLSASSVDLDDGNRLGVCRLESSPVGGSGYHVINPEIMRQILQPKIAEKFSDFLYVLSNQPPTSTKTIAIARELHDALIGSDIPGRLAALRARADLDIIRLAIATDDTFAAIPWEYLHDGTDYLVQRGYSVVRVQDRLPPGAAHFGPLNRLAVVVANPTGDQFDRFSPGEHLEQLRADLDSAKVETNEFPIATWDDVRKLFQTDERFDGLYFLGHGRAGELILESKSEKPAVLEPGTIVGWMQGWARSRQLSLIYLAACSSGEADSDGTAFSGVAQRLMSSRRVGTVIAMQAPIDPSKAMKLAGSFFEKFLRQRDPEQALEYARLSVDDQFTSATPVLYTHMEGFEHFKRNRAAALLSLPLGGTAALSLPIFRLGLPLKDHPVRTAPIHKQLKAGKRYFFPGETYARLDVEAAKELLDLLAAVAPADKILWGHSGKADVVLSIGAHHSEPLLKAHSKRFRFSFTDAAWTLFDDAFSTQYSIENPLSTRADYDYEAEDDYALLQKVRLPQLGRTLFFICGLGVRATRGAAWFLANRWEDLLADYNDGPFGVVLKLPGGCDHTYAEEIAPVQD